MYYNIARKYQEMMLPGADYYVVTSRRLNLMTNGVIEVTGAGGLAMMSWTEPRIQIKAGSRRTQVGMSWVCKQELLSERMGVDLRSCVPVYMKVGDWGLRIGFEMDNDKRASYVWNMVSNAEKGWPLVFTLEMPDSEGSRNTKEIIVEAWALPTDEAARYWLIIRELWGQCEMREMRFRTDKVVEITTLEQL